MALFKPRGTAITDVSSSREPCLDECSGNQVGSGLSSKGNLIFIDLVAALKDVMLLVWQWQLQQLSVNKIIDVSVITNLSHVVFDCPQWLHNRNVPSKLFAPGLSVNSF